MVQIAARTFLFLQGPHGPFFSTLAKALARAGHRTIRVGVNGGDGMFQRGFGDYLRYEGDPSDWATWLETFIAERAVTDLVLYGTERPLHAEALNIANRLSLRTHIFEEGYIRPWWVTYERGGSNAASRLMKMDVCEMEMALTAAGAEGDPPRAAPARWGDTKEHVFWSAVYHAAVLAGSLGKRPFPTHREPGIPAELALTLRHLVLVPWAALSRRRARWALSRAAAPYHLVLLQLAHDANFRAASPYESVNALIEDMVLAFAAGAPAHHHLVFKAHPLEDGRLPLARHIQRAVRRAHLNNRVHFMTGAPLAPLLDGAIGAVTVNSTAAHQALWRGLPVKVLGRAPFKKPEFTSSQSLQAFFLSPERPDREAYFIFRRYLLATCQVPGGFYAARARRRLLREIIDPILAEKDPFDALNPADAGTQHLRLVGKIKA
ncbi:MAG: capsule biosynthesis protein CapA [Pseudomonadota bacterium]